jgi:ligand-binding sensor domain-containing protein
MVGLLLALFPALALTNTGSGPRFERITTADGLSQGTVLAILQDQHGFMWFGSQDGLNRYDGYEIRVYRHDPNRDDSLSSNSIYSLLEGSDGYIWVGTSNGGLNRLDPGTGRFKRYNHAPDRPDSLSYRNVTTLFMDSAQRFWVGTFQGLNLFDPETEVFRSFFQ